MDKDRFEDYEINGLGEENEYILPSALEGAAISAAIVAGCIVWVAVIAFIAWAAS